MSTMGKDVKNAGTYAATSATLAGAVLVVATSGREIDSEVIVAAQTILTFVLNVVFVVFKRLLDKVGVEPVVLPMTNELPPALPTEAK